MIFSYMTFTLYSSLSPLQENWTKTAMYNGFTQPQKMWVSSCPASTNRTVRFVGIVISCLLLQGFLMQRHHWWLGQWVFVFCFFNIFVCSTAGIWSEVRNHKEAACLFGVNTTLILKHTGATGKFWPERSLTVAAIILPPNTQPFFLVRVFKKSALKCSKRNKNLFHVTHSVCFVVCSARPRTLFSFLP